MPVLLLVRSFALLLDCSSTFSNRFFFSSSERTARKKLYREQEEIRTRA